MNCWLVNHSWESFRRTKEYCGFINESERDKISPEDKIVYFGNGIVFGVFEAEKLVDNEFKDWQKGYQYQVKLKPIALSEKGLLAKQLESKILLQKSSGGSPNLVEISETNYKDIKTLICSK